MSNLFPGFHDPHNRSLDLELSVPFDCIVGIGLFLRCFLELDLVYFQAEEGGCEIGVEGECICFEDGF